MNKNENTPKKSTARRAGEQRVRIDPSSALGRSIAEYKQSSRRRGTKWKVKSVRRKPLSIGVVSYRKAYPQEILVQLEPVLREVGMTPEEVLGCFEEFFRMRGFHIISCEPQPNGQDQSGEFDYLVVTNIPGSKAMSVVSECPPVQVIRPTEIIRMEDGRTVQGFRLGEYAWSAKKPIETLFVPDYGHLFKGTLIACLWDDTKAVWIPTGKTKRVAMPWNEDSLARTKDDGGDSTQAEVVQ